MVFNVEIGTHLKSSSAFAGQNEVISHGFTPKAMIMWVTAGTVDGGQGKDGIMSIGFSEGGQEVNFGTMVKDGAAFSQNTGWTDNSALIKIYSLTALQLEASVSFQTNQSTLNWGTNGAFSGMRLHYMIFGGDDIDVDVVNFAKDTTSGVHTQSVTTNAATKNAVNGEAIVFLAISNHTSIPFDDRDTFTSFGCASHDDGNHEWTMGYGADYGTATTEVYQTFYNNKCITLSNPLAGNVIAQADFGGFTSSGFDLDWTLADTVAHRMMALIIVGASFEVGNASASTTVTTVAYTTAFEPEALLTGTTRRTANGSSLQDVSICMGFSDGVNDAYGIDVIDQGTAPTLAGNIESQASCIGIGNVAATPTINGEANVKTGGGFNALDFTLDWTNAASSAWDFGWMVCAALVVPTDAARSQATIIG